MLRLTISASFSFVTDVPLLLLFGRSSVIIKDFILAYEYLLLVAQEKYVQVCLHSLSSEKQ
jgi:hypothetical protein